MSTRLNQNNTDVDLEEGEAILYSTHKYGLIDSIAVPPDSENADAGSLRLYLSDGEENEKFKISEVLEEEQESLEDTQSLLEDEYDDIDFNLSPTYEDLEGSLYNEREFGRKKWIWGYGQSYFHEQKKRISKRKSRLKDAGMEQKASELKSKYDRDFRKVYSAKVASSVGTMAAGAALNKAPLLLTGLAIMFLGNSYGEMWHGMQIESDLEKTEYQINEN